VKLFKDYPVIVLLLVALALSNAYTLSAVRASKNVTTTPTVQAATGAKGANGADGIQGAEGEVGAVGPQGIAGATGLQGLAGIAGANGTNGLPGTAGAAGSQGSQGQSGLSSIALLHGSVTTASPSDIDTTIPVDAVNGDYGTFQQAVTSPTTGYNPGSQIAQFNFWSVGLADTRIHAYNVGINIKICDTNQNNCIELAGWAHANNSTLGDSATLTPQDLSVQSSRGSDLTYNPSTGKVTSTFGGDYSVVIVYVGTQS
jgi:hypothetical protein